MRQEWSSSGMWAAPNQTQATATELILLWVGPDARTVFCFFFPIET